MNSYQRKAQIDNRRAFLLIALVLAFLAGVGVGGMGHADPPQPTESQLATAIDLRGDHDGTTGEGQADYDDGVLMEDEPGWDCATMGNQICGP